MTISLKSGMTRFNVRLHPQVNIRPNVIKLITSLLFKFSQKVIVCALQIPFQPCLMF
jgi:hypothetical protein